MRSFLFLIAFLLATSVNAQVKWRWSPEVGIGKRDSRALPHHLPGSTSDVRDGSENGSRFNIVGVQVRYALNHFELKGGVNYMRMGYHLKFTRSMWYSSLHGPYFYEGEEELFGDIHTLALPLGISYTRVLKKYVILGAFAEGAWLWGFSHSATHGGYEFDVQYPRLFSTSASAGAVIGCKLDENGTSVELRPAFNYLLWQRREVFEPEAFSISFCVVFPLSLTKTPVSGQ